MLIKGTILQHESLATTPNNGHNSMVKKLHTPDKSCHTNKTWGICKTLYDDANCQTQLDAFTFLLTMDGKKNNKK